MEIVKVPGQAFLALVESYLSENYELWLIVKEMPEKKAFSCKEKGCGKPFDAIAPDDDHTKPSLEPIEGAVLRVPKCPDGHENEIYWTVQEPKVFFTRKTS